MALPGYTDTISHMDAAVQNKSIPPLFKKYITDALAHFPELKTVHIKFRIRPAFSPLSTRPSWGNIFRSKKNYVYIVTISNKTIEALNPILFNRLSDAAKRGVIGHELSHVSDFHKMSWWQLLRNGIGHLSPSFLDRFEYRTDSICVQHGMGNELLAWSVFVRQALHVTNWRGAGNIYKSRKGTERYMNPDTIERYLLPSGSLGQDASQY